MPPPRIREEARPTKQALPAPPPTHPASPRVSPLPPLPRPRAGFPVGGAGSALDPFSGGSKDKIHIRMQQRNGRKCTTSIQGLEDDLDLKRICKAMKKMFNCNGSIETDKEFGEVIQLQGDQRENAKKWLIEQDIIPAADAEERLVVHG
jgi:translation initiation factor 1